MTVRTWLTISAIAVVALVAAFVWRFFLAPVPVPEILLRSGDVRVPGVFQASCWPDRGGELACEQDGESPDPPGPEIEREGEMRLVVTFPARPDTGEIEVRREGRVVLEEDWTNELDYELDPGSYELTAEARYPDGAFVRYLYAFSVR